MELSIRQKGACLIVAPDGDIDHHAAAVMREVIDSEYERRRTLHIVFDFAKVGFMDSAGVGLLIGRYKLAHAMGGFVVIAGLTDTARRIVEISGLYKLMREAADADEAARALEGGYHAG